MFDTCKQIGRRRILVALTLALLVAVGAFSLRLKDTALQQGFTTQPIQSSPMLPGLGHENERFSPGLDESPSAENKTLLALGEFWHNRLTYPTGQYDPAWLFEAAAEDKTVPVGVPAGDVIYSRAQSRSPLTLDPNRWTPIGPQPENQIFGGNVSGRIQAIAVDPVSPNVAYAGVAGGGIWKSANCCTMTTTWAVVTDDPLIGTTAISDISIDPNNHNVVYASTGEVTYGYLNSGIGVLKSTDQGTTWRVLTNSPVSQFRASDKVRVDSRNSNTIAIGTNKGIYLSYDAGETWTGSCLTNPYTQQGQDVSGLILHSNGSTTDMYVAIGSIITASNVLTNGINGANGIYKATVPGSGCPANWSLITTPTNGWPAGTGSGIPGSQGGNTLGRIDINMSPSNPNYIYAQVHNAANSLQLGVWRTIDGGVSWERRSGGATLRNCSGQSEDFPQNWWNQGLVVDPANPGTIFMDTTTIFKSTDGGTTFTDVSCSLSGGNVHPDQHAITYVPGSPNKLLAGNDGGIYLTENASDPRGTWVSLNDSLNTIEFYGGDITANFANAPNPGAIGGAQDNGTSANKWYAPATPGPASWQLVLGGDGGFARIEPMQEDHWYMEYQFGRLYVSTGGPFGFTQYVEGGWFGPNDHPSFVFPYEIYKNDCPSTGCTHLIGGSQRVWETITGGLSRTSWYTNSLDLTKNLSRQSAISQLSYSVSLSTTAIVGTTDGNVQYGFGLGQGVLLSANWVNVTGNNAVLPNRPILDVATDPINPLVGYAAIGSFSQNTPSTPGHVYQIVCTTNCATFTWTNKSGNLPDIPVNTIVANPLYPQQVFAGSVWGLYYTNDINVASPTWYRFNAGLPSVMVYEMSVDAGFTTLALWTRSRGAYVWPLPSGPVAPTPMLVGHVDWQGPPPQPDSLQRLPVTITLKSGVAEVNFPTVTTDASGFFTVPLGNLSTGTYSWRAKGPKYLARSGTVNLTGVPTVSVEVGQMVTGDANNDNLVNIQDFTILKVSFGTQIGQPNYDDRTDFTGDQIINVLDFTLEKRSFGLPGAPPITPR